MNCLLYARVPTGKQAQQEIISAYLGTLRRYAEERHWTIIGEVVDEDEAVDCANKAKLKNLHHCLEKNDEVDVVVVTVSQILSFADYAALKTILDQNKQALVVLAPPSCQHLPLDGANAVFPA